MNIKGKITGIKYDIILTEKLKVYDLEGIDINKLPSCCILQNENNSYSLSKWVSPKRTRSYPFERVYNSLSSSKKITIIPIVKDEGNDGDRDFIQWDTISLMSLLDVYVIFGYYSKAVKKKNKITNQQFDNSYIISKIHEIENYHSSSLHWNLNEINTNLHSVIDLVKLSYHNIEKDTKVKLHSFNGIDNFKKRIGVDVELFMKFSRDKSLMAQSRELITIQPKESLSTLTKATITITNYLGGQYFLTCDEVLITNNKISLIEGKHSNNGLFPSKGDVKDGLLKMILYSNLENVSVNEIEMISESVLSLTSPKIKGQINTNNSDIEIENFLNDNNFTKSQLEIIKNVIKESKINKFKVQIKHSI